MKKTVEQRFWEKVDRRSPDECWLWTAMTVCKGYGRFAVSHGKNTPAHRYAYELMIGPVPDGLEIDHVKTRGCTSRACVNPAHLEAVTHQENVRRGNGYAGRLARRTHCSRGHKLGGDNVSSRDKKLGLRRCRACQLESNRKSRASRYGERMRLYGREWKRKNRDRINAARRKQPAA